MINIFRRVVQVLSPVPNMYLYFEIRKKVFNPVWSRAVITDINSSLIQMIGRNNEKSLR